MGTVIGGPLHPRARFATTRWSLVLALTSPGDARASMALATLCEQYWFPIYAFIRRSGRSADAASDLTQAFLATVIEKGTFGDARQDRGRFRSFLLGSLKHFLSNEHRHAATEKRGGGRVLVPLELDEGERRYAREPADTTTPEETYEAQWARDVFTAARARLESLHADGWMRGSRFFVPLLEHVLDEAPAPFAELAVRLQTSEGSLRVLSHRVRHKLGECLREVIADTVQSPADVDAELRHLQAVIGR